MAETQKVVHLGWLKDIFQENGVTKEVKFSPYVLLDSIINKDGTPFSNIITNLLSRTRYIRSNDKDEITVFTNGKDGTTGDEKQEIYCTIGANGITFKSNNCIVYDRSATTAIEVTFD